jgi:hypothetical protein
VSWDTRLTSHPHLSQRICCGQHLATPPEEAME